jgi:hypothetical protein
VAALPRMVVAAQVILACVGCTEPVQYGGPIAVDNAGVGARVRLLCKVTTGGHTEGRCLEAHARTAP